MPSVIFGIGINLFTTRKGLFRFPQIPSNNQSNNADGK